MRRFRLLIVSLCLFAWALALCGCCAGGQDAAAPARTDTETLVVGCDDFSPFTYKDEAGEMTGIDVEVITEACRRIGYRAEFRFIDWESKDNLLENGDIDCIASSFSVSGRESRYRWAGPYMKSRQVIAVAPESDVETFGDLAGKVIAVRSTTKAESAIISAIDDGSLGVASVYSFANRAYLVPALLKGYVDAIASHETSILQYEKDYDVDMRILDTPLLETAVGFAFAAGNDRECVEAMDAALKEMREDGTMARILSKYLDDADSYLDLEGLDDRAA